MNKVATVQTRIDPELKHDAEVILKKLGLTSSQAINALYAQIVLVKGLPFELRLPNADTIEAMQELDDGLGEHYEKIDDLIKKL